MSESELIAKILELSRTIEQKKIELERITAEMSNLDIEKSEDQDNILDLMILQQSVQEEVINMEGLMEEIK